MKKYSTRNFEELSFHDCRIHGLVFPDGKNHKLVFDIDFIEKCFFNEGEKNYSFLVAPSFLTFENIHSLKIDMPYFGAADIDQVTREQMRRPENFNYVQKEEWLWTIGCHYGAITFWSIGFELLYKEKAKKNDRQYLKSNER